MTNKYLLIGGIAATFITMPFSPAIAGFQFTAPIQQQTQQQAVPPLNGALLPQVPNISIEGEMPAAPVNNVEGGPVSLLPEPTNDTAALPRAPQTGIGSLAPRQATPVAVQSAPQTNSSYEMAVGFGKNLPLVTALRQVVPADYTYIVDDSIPMSATVSWDGGRPWNEVLNDMVTPLNLQTRISGNRVSIMQDAPQMPMANAAPAPIAQAAAQPVTPVAQPIAWAPAQTTVQEVEPVASWEQVPAAPQPTVYQPAPQQYTPPIVQEVAVQPQPKVQFTAPPPAPVSQLVPAVTRGTWVANKGDSLRNVLDEWANQAGADMFWSSDYDYPLAGAVNVSGSFEEAVQNLLRGFEQARPKPIARLHPNLPHGPAVLVVETLQSLD